MANLQATTIDTSVAASVLKRISDGGAAIDVDSLPADALYTRQYVLQHDKVNRTFTDTFALATTFPTVTDLLGNSKILLEWFVPLRNDNSSNWGGAVMEMQVQFDGGTWQSLHTTGHSCCMHFGTSAIKSYHNMMLIDPAIATTFTVAFRLYVRSFNGTLWYGALNRDIGLVSGTAALLDGVIQDQWYPTLHIREIAKVSGV